jgi:hypothetical protein
LDSDDSVKSQNALRPVDRDTPAGVGPVAQLDRASAF